MLANRTIGYAVENKGNKPILVGLEGAFNDYFKGAKWFNANGKN